MLDKANIIPTELSNYLQAMVGFKNIAIHDYTQLNLDIIKNTIENHLSDFQKFIKVIINM